MSLLKQLLISVTVAIVAILIGTLAFSIGAARQYLERIEEIGGVPVHLISTSPDRAHTILRRHPFAASAV